MNKMFSGLIITLIISTLITQNTSAIQDKQAFQRIATFPVTLNNPGAELNVAEIVSATSDGMTLVYTDIHQTV